MPICGGREAGSLHWSKPVGWGCWSTPPSSWVTPDWPACPSPELHPATPHPQMPPVSSRWAGGVGLPEMCWLACCGGSRAGPTPWGLQLQQSLGLRNAGNSWTLAIITAAVPKAQRCVKTATGVISPLQGSRAEERSHAGQARQQEGEKPP